MELYVPATPYKVKGGIPLTRPLPDTHVRCGVRTVVAVRVHRIPDRSAATLGFEVLPRYSTTEVGERDPLNVNYELKDGKITIDIKLSPDVEQKLGAWGGGR